MVQRAILTPLNDDVDIVNKLANDLFTLSDSPDGRKVLLSIDTIAEEAQSHAFPMEFLNTLKFSGMLPHRLDLQEGAPIILLRNLAQGLANGTRLILKKMHPSLLEATVATGPCQGDTVLLPRLTITPSDVDVWPFTLRRRQYPVRPAFAMSVKKSQGQTLGRVGMYLSKPVFAHGQLYVGASRCGHPDGVSVLVPGCNAQEEGRGLYTKNIVYKEVLLD